MSTQTDTKSKRGADKANERKDAEEIRKSVSEDERDDLETLEFLRAVDRFKRKTNKSFPSWTEILQILKSLGYRKVD